MKLWAFGIIIAGFFGGVWGLVHLWTDLSETKRENLILEARAEAFEINMVLVQNQLAVERKIRDATEVALSSLREEVSDAEYKQAVPESIQRVLNQFRQSLSIDGL